MFVIVSRGKEELDKVQESVKDDNDGEEGKEVIRKGRVWKWMES